MTQYNVKGMTCAACSTRVEKTVKSVVGVKACTVSLLTNSMMVEGGNPADIVNAVRKAGYDAKVLGKNSGDGSDYSFKDTEAPKLRKRLILSVSFLAVLMYISMGYVMWNFPLPQFFERNPVAVALLQLILTLPILVINRNFFINGIKGVIHHSPNMDTLVALGATAAFGYSVFITFSMSCLVVKGLTDNLPHLLHELYFESAGMILTLITVGKLLEAKAKGRTTDALKNLLNLSPKTARLLIDGEEKIVSVSEVKPGDIFAVKPGDSIPVDGVVLEGLSTVDEAALTGESIPVEKTAGGLVSAATVNTSGYLKCEAVRVGEDTALAGIIRTVRDASMTKAPIARVADKVSGVFVPVVICIAIITLVVWLILGESIGFSLSRAISVLVISCPCALGLATPVAIMVGSGVGAGNGILFKTAAALETAGRIKTVALDKTGTVTTGKPKVMGIYPLNRSENEVLKLASALEFKSQHPLACAVVDKANENGIEILEVSDFQAYHGNGVGAKLGTSNLLGGSLRFISQKMSVPREISGLVTELSDKGETPLIFSENSEIIGIISVADAIKPESNEAIRELKSMGIKVVMLTGDNQNTAKAIGKEAGIEHIIAGVLPIEKKNEVTALKRYGKVAMVGDGINDAPALTEADLGIAIGQGTDIAVDSADVVLMKSNLFDVAAVIRLGQKTLKNIRENLFWAFIYNCIGIPLASGMFIYKFGWELNPMFGALAMSLSSICVVLNALRLNFVPIYNKKYDNTKSLKNTEKTKMEKTLKIEGMMCTHCESHVKKALEALDGVESVAVSHEKGSATVILKKEISDEALKTVVEAEGYKVI